MDLHLPRKCPGRQRVPGNAVSFAIPGRKTSGGMVGAENRLSSVAANNGPMIKLTSPSKQAARGNRRVRLFVCLLMGLSLALVTERLRGQWTLKSWKSRMAAKGELFEAPRLWPPASAANAAFSNGLAQATGDLRGRLADYAGQLSGIIGEQPGTYRRGSQEPRPPRLRNDGGTNTWQKLDDLIQQSQPSLQSLCELMMHPPATMGRDIASDLEEAGSFPNFVGVRVGAQTLQAAVINDLHNGDRDRAVQDLTTLLAFARLHEQDPSLVGYMIRMAIIGLSIDVCWDALQADGWTELQLAALQQAGPDPGRMLTQMARTIESERACRLYQWQWFRSHSYQAWLDRHRELYQSFGMVNQVPAAAPPLQQWVFHPLWRFAWADQEELGYLRQTQWDIDCLREAAQHRSWLRLKDQITTHQKDYRAPVAAWRYYGSLPLVDRLSVVIVPNKVPEPAYPYPDFTRAWFTSMKNLTLHQMAISAVALKRYGLRHGHPPATLADLVPEFLGSLPADLMDGEPLRYQLKPDGTFLLYSVGEDLEDNGGDLTSDSIGTGWQEISPWNGRDWVWPQSDAVVKVPPVPKVALQHASE